MAKRRPSGDGMVRKRSWVEFWYENHCKPQLRPSTQMINF